MAHSSDQLRLGNVELQRLHVSVGLRCTIQRAIPVQFAPGKQRLYVVRALLGHERDLVPRIGSLGAKGLAECSAHFVLLLVRRVAAVQGILAHLVERPQRIFPEVERHPGIDVQHSSRSAGLVVFVTH